MQPCGLRDLARPRERRSFGLKVGRVADCIRGALAQRGLKNIHATLRAAGFGTSLGATGVWPQGRASCGLRPRHLGPKGSKKQSCNPASCRIWRALGGDFRLASRPGELRAARAAPLAQRGLKNIHATLRAAGFNAPSGATIVWPQGRASCRLHPRHLGPKGSKKHSYGPAGCGIWRALGGDFRLASRPGNLRNASAAPWPKESKKTFLQPCGLRDLARPRGRRSFGLKAGQVAD